MKRNSKRRDSVKTKPDRQQAVPFVRGDACAMAAHITESAIFQVHLTVQRRLTDRNVKTAITRMLRLVAQGRLRFPPADENDLFDSVDVHDYLIWSIGQKWRDLATEGYRLSRREIAGVLASILTSVDCWTTSADRSQGYLQYLETLLVKGDVIRCDRGYETRLLGPRHLSSQKTLDCRIPWLVDGTDVTNVTGRRVN